MGSRSDTPGHWRIALGALCALALLANAAGADCPVGSFRFPQDASLGSLQASAWDTTVTQPFSVAHAGYDLAAGTAHFDVDSAPAAILYLLLRDQFTIEGTPPGTVCSVRAELHFTGSLLAYGGHGTAAYASAALRVGGAPEASVFVPDNGPGNVTPFDRVLTVDVDVPAGVPFSLDLDFEGGANVGGDAKADAHATLVVTTTAPSGRAVSCHGYGRATAVQARTWGALKARYR
jgi:hypothetical protein